MTRPASSRMSRVDTAWLRMDNEVNLMMIVGVWLLSPAIDIAALRERINDKLLKYDRFRQKAVHDAMGALWVDDQAFDLQQHVVTETLKRRRGQSERAALQQRCGELATTPLDPSRPLWQFHLVEQYEGGCAIIARVHHCIGDGIALISVMMSITDGGNDPPKRTKRDVAPELPSRTEVVHMIELSEVERNLYDGAVRALESRQVDGLDLEGIALAA